MPDPTSDPDEEAPRWERSRIVRWALRRSAERAGLDPQRFDPTATDDTLGYARKVFGPGRYFDLDVRGWEHLPASPVLMVSNHSGGTTIPDVWGMMVAWYDRHGTGRPLHPLAHEFILATETTGRFFERRGVLRADPRVALPTLIDHRRDVLVYPGGDLDTWRPYSARWEIRFGGRTGYARMALKAGVPVVPVAHAGAHETLRVLTDGRRVAELIGLKRLARASVFPIHLSVPWGLAVGPWPHIPLPARLRYRIGEPIASWDYADPRKDPPEDAVQALDRRVRDAVQGLLDDLRIEATAGGY